MLLAGINDCYSVTQLRVVCSGGLNNEVSYPGTLTETVTNDTIPLEQIRTFKTALRGQLILPEEAGYDEARRVWNGMIDKRPRLVVRPLGVSDVIICVNFAREYHLPVAVRGGGHNVAGFGTCDGGIVIDFSKMKGVRVDPSAKTARAEPGATWREFDFETQALGLATTGGLVSSTGIAGFTLGGGIGWLVRKHGLAADNLISVDIVTADGKLRKASMEENPDLFWGVRGGGGNFGVIASFEYNLHPVGPIVLGGMMLFPEDRARDVLRGFSTISKSFPEELTTLAALITAPPLPFIPAEFHGKRCVAILACYLGSVGDGERFLRPLRELKPIADVIGPMPYLALQTMLDESAPPGLQNYWKSTYLESLGDEAIDVLLSRFRDVPSHLSAIHMHHLGGAVRRVGEDATAFGDRDATFVVNIVSSWTDPNENDAQVAWTRKTFDALSEFSKGGAYINFLGQEGGERVKAAYGPAKYGRLVELKRKYDPENLFHLNQNVKP